MAPEVIPGYQCPGDIELQIVSDVPQSMAKKVEGVVTFDNIVVEGPSCAINAVDPVLRLISFYHLVKNSLE